MVIAGIIIAHLVDTDEEFGAACAKGSDTMAAGGSGAIGGECGSIFDRSEFRFGRAQ
ncbi:hypothetical protein HGG76_25030 [Ochrobactrum tritici]|uniref:Uncharacterized protein n=1 Tax=Brucella tritici TaxID=94626 RepID=A0A7X6JBH6_9HYPH|nr:hypothetical protein [Brucella tritici]